MIDLLNLHEVGPSLSGQLVSRSKCMGETGNRLVMTAEACSIRLVEVFETCNQREIFSAYGSGRVAFIRRNPLHSFSR